MRDNQLIIVFTFITYLLYLQWFIKKWSRPLNPELIWFSSAPCHITLPWVFNQPRPSWKQIQTLMRQTRLIQTIFSSGIVPGRFQIWFRPNSRPIQARIGPTIKNNFHQIVLDEEQVIYQMVLLSTLRPASDLFWIGSRPCMEDVQINLRLVSQWFQKFRSV